LNENEKFPKQILAYLVLNSIHRLCYY